MREHELTIDDRRALLARLIREMPESEIDEAVLFDAIAKRFDVRTKAFKAHTRVVITRRRRRAVSVRRRRRIVEKGVADGGRVHDLPESETDSTQANGRMDGKRGERRRT